MATAPFRSRLRGRGPLDMTSWFRLVQARLWPAWFAKWAAIIAALSGLSAPAQTIAGFDDLPVPFPDFVLPTREPFDYQGLSWKGFYVVRSGHGLADNFPQSGLRLGRVSGEFVAVAARRGLEFSEVAAPDRAKFTFLGAHLTSGWRRGLNVTLTGISGGQAVSIKRVVIEPDKPRFIEANFENIDSVRIQSEGGEDAGLCNSPVCEPGPEVVVDDFTFTFGASAEPVTQAPEEALLASARPAAAPSQPVPDPEPPVPEPVVTTAPAQEPAAALAATAATPEPEPVTVSKPEPGVVPATPAIPSSQCGSTAYHGVQVGAFRSKSNAMNLRRRLAAQFGVAQTYERIAGDAPLFVVVVGCHEDRTGAASQRQTLSDAGVDGILVRASVARLGNVVSPDP